MMPFVDFVSGLFLSVGWEREVEEGGEEDDREEGGLMGAVRSVRARESVESVVRMRISQSDFGVRIRALGREDARILTEEWMLASVPHTDVWKCRLRREERKEKPTY